MKTDAHPIKPIHLAVVTLWAEDVPTTAHFYRDVIGLDLMPHHGQRPAFDLGHGTHLVILRGQPVAAVDHATTEQSGSPVVAGCGYGLGVVVWSIGEVLLQLLSLNLREA